MNEQKTGQIDRRDRLSYREFLHEYVIPHRPVVVQNAFSEWRALKEWTPEFFKQKLGDREVRIAGKPMKLGEYIDAVLAATPEKPVPYLRECVIRELAPELGEYLAPFISYALPNWLRGYYPGYLNGALNRAAEPELFIGGPGTRLERRKVDQQGGYVGVHGERIEGFADLHQDPTACPVLLCQIYGQKHFTIFAPEDRPYLYAQGRLSMMPNIDQPDYDKYPLFKQATPIRFVQQPGEAVYVPPLWWHATRMVTISIAVSSTFAHHAHWDGVVDELTRGTVEERPLVGQAMRAYLELDGRAKSLLGERYGEDHFRPSPLRRALRAVKRVIKREAANA